ncbi:hypothetical protein TTV14_gp2 [Torque teno virus 14]|uniref:Capsid protein n=1 Tax=Torque teno virus 14 TaxID=687353 RepID=Q9DUH8_9VIRU|nr:hypothetical protein TTV14_gp2 [Torque teno virus 14]BAB18902.1 unnamed protein product [Torque teno virus 14]
MPWGWWRRWRRRPRRWRRWRRWGRRRTRWGLRTRRARAAVRRRRRGRVRRRARGGRRYHYRRRFRRRRARRRKKIVLTQWNPQTVRKCLIRGMFPILWCGSGAAGKNYALHMDDYTPSGGFGGSFSLTTFNLRALYDEHMKGRNRWSHTNEDLELALYFGCRFTFYRHPTTDFIVTFSNTPPMMSNQYTAPLAHPGMLMRSKYKLLLPSFKTRPGGKKTVSVRIRPPKLFNHKWYAQSDLCDVNLVQFTVTAADFMHPFGSPLTETPCVTFQVLGDLYNKCLNIDLPKVDTVKNASSPHTKIQVKLTDNSGNPTNKEAVKTLYEQLFSYGQYWQTFITDFMTANPPKYDNGNNKKLFNDNDYNTFKTTFLTKKDSGYLFASYNPAQVAENIKNIRDQNFALTTGKNDVFGDSKAQYHNATHLLDYKLGIYSPVFLHPGRSNIQMWTAYRDIVYNPFLDKGEGNKVWYQYHTKTDNKYDPTKCRYMVEDLPLWSLLHGYADYIISQIKYGDPLVEGKVLIRCPYTRPALYNKQSPDEGYVVYNTYFGMGKWVDGSGYIPIPERARWMVMLKYQLDVFHDLVVCGPWAYRDDEKSVQMPCKYKFRFKWGGTTLRSQVIRNPCSGGDVAPAYPHRRPRDEQVVDPRVVGPQWSSTPGTRDEDCLARKLSDECSRSRTLAKSLLQAQKDLSCLCQQRSPKEEKETLLRQRRRDSPRGRKRRAARRRTPPRKSKKRRDTSSSESSQNSDSSGGSWSSWRSSSPKPSRAYT